MNKPTSSFATAISLLLVSFTAIVLIAQQYPPSNAAQNGTGIPAGFQPYGTHTFILDSTSFPPGSAAYNNVVLSLQNSQRAYSFMNSGYFFQSAPYIPQLQPGETYVTGQTFSDPTQMGFNQPLTSHFDYIYGKMTIDTNLITISNSILDNPAAVQLATAHEDSHDYFLGDCPLCDLTTAMTYQIDYYNPPYVTAQPNDYQTAYRLLNFGAE